MRRGRTILRVVAAALLLPLVGGPVDVSADIARPETVGRMPIFAPEGLYQGQYPQSQNAQVSMVLNPATRRGYQIHPGSPFRVSAWNLDTFEHLGTVEVPWTLGEPSPHLVDEEGGRVFIPVGGLMGFSGMVVLDEARFSQGIDAFRFIPAPSHPAYSNLPAGMRYEPRLGKIMLFLNPQRFADAMSLGTTRGRQPTYTNFLAQWDPNTGTEDWLHLVRPCSSAALPFEMGAAATPFLNRAGDGINLVCSVGEYDAQLTQVRLGDDGVPTGDVITMPGASMVGDILVDPARERVHLIAGQSYVVTLDWTERRTVGTAVLSAVAHSNLVGAGIDLQTGRLVVPVPITQSPTPGIPDEPGGLFLVDGRRTPLPQALAYREITGERAANPALIDPAADGRPRRTFLRYTLPQNPNAADPYFTVIEDPVPISADPPSADLDPTSDIDEEEGKTQRSYAAETSGYGSRALVVGGLDAGARIEDSSGPCGMANRDLLLASVERAGLSSVSGAARAHPVDADLGTQADLGDLGRCFGGGLSRGLRYPPPPDAVHGTGPGWTSSPAECSGADDDESSDPQRPGSRAEASCSYPDEKIDAATLYPGLDLGLVRVANSRSQTSIKRDPDLGVVSVVESTAEGIEISGVGSIGAVRSTAMSRANGRIPRDGDPSRTTWSVEICDVHTEGMEVAGCHPIDDAKALIDGLNQAGRGRVVFNRHRPDPDLLAGSPGGYLAGIQKDPGDAAVAKLENGDELLTVAGLEIVVRTSWRPTDTNVRRYMVQLAGVRAVTTYGITDVSSDIEPHEDVPQVAEEVLAEVSAPAPVAAADDGPVEVSAGGGAAEEPASLIEEVVRQPERVLREGLAFLLRNPMQALAALGVWVTLASPAYLAARRRRIGAAA